MHTPLRWLCAALGAGVLAACHSPAHHDATAPQAAQASFQQAVGTPKSPQAVTAANPAPATLTAYHWQLRAVSGPDQAWFNRLVPALRAPVQLTFDDQRVAIDGLCNRMGASYTLDGAALRISQAFSTKRACLEGGLMQLEDAVGRQLPNARQWALTESQAGAAPALALHFADGSIWQLQGTPTDATRFGSTPQRVFLEVQPTTVACTQNGQAAQCLRVRSVAFDEAGLRQGEGPWQDYAGRIEGFTHEPGQRTVLRINRYTVAPALRQSAGIAAGTETVDVLDMVVSSELVQPPR